MFGRTIRTALLAGAVAMPIPANVYAQTAEDDSVNSRARPGFDSIGIELDELLGVIGLVSDKAIEQKNSVFSSFVVNPSFGVTGTYETNIFLTQNDTVADKRTDFKPGVSIQSDWGRHAVSMTASGTFARHAENIDEDYNDYQVQFNGSLNIHDNKSLTIVSGIAQRHNSRDAEDDPGRGFDPTISFNNFTDITFEYLADALLARFKFNFEHQDFHDTGNFDNDPGDLSLIDMSLRLAYEFSPGTKIFIQPKAGFRIFDQKRDAEGSLQDNQSIGGLVGVTWDLTGVTFAEFGIGLVRQTYANPNFESPTNLDFSGKLIWNPNDLFTISSNLTRSTSESNTAGESGVLSTGWSNSIDYDFLDNVIISAGFSFGVSTNQETKREDNDRSITAGIRYLVNENWSANLNFGNSIRSSTVAGENFKNFTVGFGLTGKL